MNSNTGSYRGYRIKSCTSKPSTAQRAVAVVVLYCTSVKSTDGRKTLGTTTTTQTPTHDGSLAAASAHSSTASNDVRDTPPRGDARRSKWRQKFLVCARTQRRAQGATENSY